MHKTLLTMFVYYFIFFGKTLLFKNQNVPHFFLLVWSIICRKKYLCSLPHSFFFPHSMLLLALYIVLATISVVAHGLELHMLRATDTQPYGLANKKMRAVKWHTSCCWFSARLTASILQSHKEKQQLVTVAWPKLFWLCATSLQCCCLWNSYFKARDQVYSY